MTRLLPLNPDNTASVQVPTPGEVLGGKYRVEREIGSGGMGIVYEVTHLVMTKKRFAVKWLLPLPDGYQGEDAQAAARRFVREAEIAGGIEHPNVVQVYDVTIGESGCFMVMELLEGESLEARLKRETQLPVAEACRIIIACASGVAAAHAANVIHRDLKPPNIFLVAMPNAEPSRPKVLDFGISRFTAPDGTMQSTVTRAGTLIGTPMYMAPEQLRGFECDVRTDVYGLGVTLYESLSGKPAFHAPTHADLVVRILTGDTPDLRGQNPAVPAGLSAVVMQALHHKPELRFATVEALVDALRPYATDAAAASTGAAQPDRKRGTSWLLWLAVCASIFAAAALIARWTASAPETAQPAAPSETAPSPEPQPPPPTAAETNTAQPTPTHTPESQPSAADSTPPADTPVAPAPAPAPTPRERAAEPARSRHRASRPTSPQAPAREEPTQSPRKPKPRPSLDSL
jgi:eukaryotic-like serine/threonine-protein kinase